jgi:hypothetical protein
MVFEVVEDRLIKRLISSGTATTHGLAGKKVLFIFSI